MPKVQNWRIVNLRVLATLIVVLGHSIIIFDPNWANSFGYHPSTEIPPVATLKHCINQFQMELFFMISGFCFWYGWEKRKSYIKFIQDKGARLLIPFVVVAFFWMVPLKFIARYPGYLNSSIFQVIYNILTLRDAGHLWFLPVLFLVMLCTLTMNKYVKNTYIVITASVIIHIIAQSVNTPLLSLTAKYLIFFLIGQYINKFEGLDNKTIVLILVAFTILLGTIFFILGLQNSIISLVFKICLVTSMYFLIPRYSNKWIAYIDKNSFGIYLLHSPLLYIGMLYLTFLPPPIYIFSQFILSVLISVIIIHFLRKQNFSKLLGE